ncbi:MAG TPA: dolichyl-phosphate beta-glucosyltransferase [Terriglobia bacterium]|nr:dolichyl-phosphate beta-glucosyltransferase [Terriglobia bacterium]
MATSETVPGARPVDKLSIVIPAFNEAARIRDSLHRIAEYLKSVPFDTEILVIDDGSTDDTAAIVERLEIRGLRLLRNGTNRGKGYSVRDGVLAATGDYILFTDADLSAPIEEMDKLLKAAMKENADAVVGSRGLDSRFIDTHQSSIRETGGRFFNQMVQIFLGLKIQDTQCGFKLFKRASVQWAFQKLTTDGFGFDPEVLFIMSRQGLKIVEVPVRWSHVEGSKIRFLRDGTRMFLDLLRIRWNSSMGRYS